MAGCIGKKKDGTAYECRDLESTNACDDPCYPRLSCSGSSPDTCYCYWAPAANLARSCGKNRNEACPTAQSSIDNGGLSERAVDGKFDSIFNGKSCTHTRDELNPWWRLNFTRNVKVTGIRITGRTDCCSDRLQGFNVYVGNSDKPTDNAVCATNQNANSAKNSTVEVKCQTPVSGLYLYVYLPKKVTLTLCEMEVFGVEVVLCMLTSKLLTYIRITLYSLLSSLFVYGLGCLLLSFLIPLCFHSSSCSFFFSEFLSSSWGLAY